MFTFRTFYPKDLESQTIQKNLNNTIRLGRIVGVNAQEGTCTIQWFDRQGFRTDVILTQPSSNTYFIPQKGTIVLVGFDSREQARILQYIPVGQSMRVKKLKTLPKFKEDDSFLESGGSYVFIRNNGDIIVTTATESYLLLENSTGTLKSETINRKTLTQGGMEYLGLIKRFQVNSDGTSSLNFVTDPLGNYLTEYNLKVLETADNEVGVQGLQNPIVEINFGNVVDSLGNVIMKNNLPAPTTNVKKQLAVRLKLKSGVEIDIDKDGRITIGGGVVNINQGLVDIGDPDISLGLETASTAVGNKGQHVAREHDQITVPLSTGYTDPDHAGLSSKGSSNYTILQQLAKYIISPAGACFLLPISAMALKGEITEGAPNMYVGDK